MHQAVMQTRGMLVRGVIHAVDDTGEAQTVDVSTHTDITRAQVEVAQFFGFASNPPAGAFSVMLSMGGDEGDMLALPPTHPQYRYGKLAAGEAVLYGADGSRVVVRTGGVIEITAGAEVHITAPACVIDANVTINGNLVVNGGISATGDVSDGHGALSRLRNHYDGHVHGSSPGTSQPD